MQVTVDHLQAAAALASLNPNEAVMLIAAAKNQILHSQEDAKSHHLEAIEFTDDQWASFKEHLMDGGGVFNDFDLHTKFMNALLADDRKTVMKELPHIVKAWLKIKGRVRPMAGGGVFMSGAQHSGTLEIDQLEIDQKETKNDVGV